MMNSRRCLTVYATNCKFVVIGDLNVHVDDFGDARTIQLNDVIDSYGLKQHVSSSTHNCGHTLDLIITTDDFPLQYLRVRDVASLSDHKCLQFQLPGNSADSTTGVTFTSRNWSQFDVDAFEAELATSQLAVAHTDDVDWLFDEYDSYLRQLLDKRAPKREVTRRPRRHALWFDGDCSLAKM